MSRFIYDINSFIDEVVPKNASDIQKQEMRRAFIAGAKIAAHRIAVEGDKDYKQQIDIEFERIENE